MLDLTADVSAGLMKTNIGRRPLSGVGAEGRWQPSKCINVARPNSGGRNQAAIVEAGLLEEVVIRGDVALLVNGFAVFIGAQIDS